MWPLRKLINLYRDPDPEGKAGGGDNKESDKKPDQKPKPEPEGDTTIPFKLPGGKVIELSPEQAIQAATYGLIRMEEERAGKGKKETKPEPETEEDEVTVLKSKVDKLEKEKQHEKSVKEINDTLYMLEQSHKETKNNNKLAQKISQLTLARININPSLSFSKVFKEELTDYLEMIPKEEKEEKPDVNAAVRKSMIKTIRGGSAPVVESEKKYGVKEFKSGESRKAMLAWAERAQQENQ